MTIREATDVFSDWALRNRDEGMESGHAKSVNEMLGIAIPMLKKPFSAIDVGCGNGWVCRQLETYESCIRVVGIDGSVEMIVKAKEKGSGEFHLAKLPGWEPSKKFDLIHSMEFLYYLKDPLDMLRIFFPGETVILFEQTVQDLLDKTQGTLLSITFVLTLVYASSSINAILSGFNASPLIENKGSTWYSSLVSIVLLVVLVLMLGLAVILIT